MANHDWHETDDLRSDLRDFIERIGLLVAFTSSASLMAFLCWTIADAVRSGVLTHGANAILKLFH